MEARILRIDEDSPLAPMLRGINHMLDTTDAFVREARAALSFASEGRYFRRVLPAGLKGSFRHAAETINAATRQMGEEARKLEEIGASAEKVNILLAEIATASQEQSEGITQVTTGVAELDAVTQQNAGNAEEIARAEEGRGGVSVPWP